MGLLAKLRPTINFPWEGPWAISEMSPKYKMHQEIRMLNATHVAFCELLKFRPTSNIEVYIFNINIYIDMVCVFVYLSNYILLTHQSSQSLDAQVL